MFLSKRPSGIYYIYYEDSNGKRQAISTKSKLKSEALKFLTNFKSEILERTSRKTIPITLDKFQFEFLKHSEAIHTPKTTKTFVTTFKYMLEFFGDPIISELTERDIRRFIDYRIKNPSIYQARKDLINISSSFTWAINEEYLVQNPCANIKRLKTPQKLPLFFSYAEFEQLLKVIDNEEFKALVIIAVNTGLREMELLSLQWNQIFIEKGILILDNQNHITKSKKIRTLPLNTSVIKALLQLKTFPDSDNLVFPFKKITNRPKFVQNNFRAYIKLAKLNSKLNFHSLRHTFASWLVQKGVSIYEVSKLLGHADIKTTQIYAHLRSDDLRNAVERLD